MRVVAPPSPPLSSSTAKDAESLFRTKPISEIRNVEAATRKQIEDKSGELRQLVGNRYRDLIDSADSILLMKSSCHSISANVSAVHRGILHSLSPSPSPSPSLSPARARVYSIACRVKYLVDTPENIWGCLDEAMFLEAAARYVRAKHVHQCLLFDDADNKNSSSLLSNFPLLHHQWQIVESFKTQISQRSRERLLDQFLGLGISAYADALAAVAVIDDLDPSQTLCLFLDSRKSGISQKLGNCPSISADVVSVFCHVLQIIQISVAQVGELFLQVLSSMPLFYHAILGSPPASQLFGGIPNPDEEIRLWMSFRDRLESVMVMLDRRYIADTCSAWLNDCGRVIVNQINGKYLIDAIDSGQQLSAAEKLIRETMEGKHVLGGSLEWLKNVFGSEIEMPWNRVRELVLEDDSDLWDEIFEDTFTRRMKGIIDLGFGELNKSVNVKESTCLIVVAPVDFQAYLSRSSRGGGVWFAEPNSKVTFPMNGSKTTHNEEKDLRDSLNAYFGEEVCRIRDEVDRCCETVLEDLLSFIESPKASLRLEVLAPYLQSKCLASMSTILSELKDEVEHLSEALGHDKDDGEVGPPPTVVVERTLFIGRLLFALQKYSRHVPMILGSPRWWLNEMPTVSGKSPTPLKLSGSVIDSISNDSPLKKSLDSSKRQTSFSVSALCGVEDASSSHFAELYRTTQDLSHRAHNLWISWVSDKLSAILSSNLRQDGSLSATNLLRGWEETVVKQEPSAESQSEIKIALPSMPSLYVVSCIFQACEEVHRVGGHVLDKSILQNFASRLFEKVLGVYEVFLSTDGTHVTQVSEKGVLQILLDLRRKQDAQATRSVIRERMDVLTNCLSQRLDPIDWLTYEPYLWENEKQSYLRHAVLFGFFVQLHRLYTDTVQKLPANSESNIMRCSSVPRFKYLPISAPVLSAKGASKASFSTSDDVSSMSSWKTYMREDLSRDSEMDGNASLGVAAPFLKSFMQVGSRFGESTLKLGSMLTDGQVGRFGEILPAQAAGLLSSFTAARSVN